VGVVLAAGWASKKNVLQEINRKAADIKWATRLMGTSPLSYGIVLERVKLQEDIEAKQKSLRFLGGFRV
jgi:hypothetical protein